MRRGSVIFSVFSFYLFTFYLFNTLVLAGLACAQSFDEDFHLWPTDLKINGTIVACGGTDLTLSGVEILESAAKKEGAKTIVVRFYDPDKFGYHHEAVEQAIEALLESPKGLEQFKVPTKPAQLKDETAKSIEAANAVWILTDEIPKSDTALLKQTFSAAKTVVENGGTLCVSGPGVEYLGRFKTGLSSKVETSHLIPDTVIKTGYVDKDHRPESLGLLAQHPRNVGIGIPDDTAIVLRHRKIRVLGEGKATFCLSANEHVPLRIQHVGERKSRRADPYKTIVDLTAWRRDAIDRTVEPFPAEKPPVPNVENGTLLIVGGGSVPRGLMDRLVELAGGKENAKLVFVPCSEADEVSAKHRTVEAWKKMGVESATFIHTKDRVKANSDEEFLAPLKDATGIWFGGGRQWNFSDSYYGTKAHELMKGVLKRGGVIGGSSAGASIQAAYMCRANPVANFDIMAPGYERGLGFIRGVAIDQHFSQRRRQKDMTQLVNRYPQLLGIGIDESTALVVQKSRAEVVGRGKVYFYDRNQPVVPGEDDFLALKSGSVFDLAEREVVED